MAFLAYAAYALVLTSACLYLFWHGRFLKTPLNNTNIALVIAHPDDEVMFFGPTLAELTRPEYNNQVRVLCLSSGNHDGLGDIRKKELVNSLKTFGLRENHLTILDREDLKDGPKEMWDLSLVGDQMNLFAKKHAIETLITFDERGVSGHTNHIACFLGLSYFVRTFKDRTTVKYCYVLKTVSLLRKYISILDLPATMLFTEALLPLVSQITGVGAAASLIGAENSITNPGRGGSGGSNRRVLRPKDLLFVSPIPAVVQAKAAMQKHESQMVWFRKIYVVASRYMAINELRRVM
ncbi:N-acetylglucosaminyl-phosphatidylinositol de-N-acetylase [Actinomortierella ambigua]|nr:N-acetylglucosaminyl-phosphatidylinositol de-N-acetylase [Actinomortierella ambigua]